MQTRNFLFTLLAATLLATAPAQATQGTEQADTTAAQIIANSAMTVNGRPATPQEKAVAKQMAKKGAQMAKKGVQMAMTAVTNPDKAEKMGEELEAMGEQMERLGDSLETLTEDTVFFYDEAAADSLLAEGDADSDLDDFFDFDDSGWMHSWWGQLLGGSLGVMGGLLGVCIAILICLLLFFVLLSPIWVLALIIWLIVRGTSTKPTTTYQNPPLNSVASPAGQQTAANEQAQTSAPNPQPSNFNYSQPYPDENTELWKSGIMYSCVGVGLVLFFWGIGFDGLWGIGALVACIGVAKLVIASTTKRRKHDQNQQHPTDLDYSKNEN